MKQNDRYSVIIETIFGSKYKRGLREVRFERKEFAKVAKKLRIDLPKNLGDIVYSFRYRRPLPKSIRSKAGKDEVWIIRPAGRAKYKLVLVRDRPLIPGKGLTATKIPDSTPGVVAKYSFNDEQALLTRIRYNRLVDIFTGVTCYSLQNHLRTTVPDMGQVETDEIYVGVDGRGVHHVFPMQAKGGKDRLNVVQIEQDFAVCAHRFPSLVCRPLAAQFMPGGRIALFEFAEDDEGVGIARQMHYVLVPPGDITDEDLKAYKRLMPG